MCVWQGGILSQEHLVFISSAAKFLWGSKVRISKVRWTKIRLGTKVWEQKSSRIKHPGTNVKGSKVRGTKVLQPAKSITTTWLPSSIMIGLPDTVVDCKFIHSFTYTLPFWNLVYQKSCYLSLGYIQGVCVTQRSDLHYMLPKNSQAHVWKSANSQV